MLRWKSSLKPTSGGGGGGTNGLSTGLIRAYLAEDLTDELGNANLTVRGSGISSTTGKNNNCYTYSTSGGHVSDWFPDSNNWTISCWINADAIDSATFDGTIGCHDNNNHRAYFGLGNSNEAVVGVGDSYDTDSAATYSAGTWYNFITIWDGTNAWCFINGVLRIKFAANFSGTSTDALHLGERIYNGGTQYNQYDGKQDETYIWSRALDVGSATSVGDTGGGDIANLQTLFYASFNGVADYRSTVLADNPLFYYRLGETSGTTALDEVTSSSNGTYPTVPLLGQTGAISGDSNKCPLFREANSEYAETVTLSSETSLLPCTIECFIKTDGASDHTGGILMIRGATNASGLNMYGPSTSEKRLGYHWNNGSATWQFSSGPTFADDTWYYVALVIESTKATFYMIDESGTLTTPAVKTTTHAAIDVSSNGWTIGRDYGYANRSFQGYIDEVAIYDQAFSQSKVVAHAAAAGYTASSFLFTETFEGSESDNQGTSGYDNTGWTTVVTQSGFLANPNFTPALAGSASYQLKEQSAAPYTSDTAVNSFTASANIYMYFIWKMPYMGAEFGSGSNAKIKIQDASGNQLIAIGPHYDNLQLKDDGTNTATLSSSVPVKDDVIHFWIDRISGTSIELRYASSATRPASAALTISSPSGSADAAKVLLKAGHPSLGLGVYDNLVIDTSSIGSNPI
tara:strand:- start:21 stop:2081 length:2061 start_codon:yes stop_codon:yes gene_type:complete